jgi:hypothetical protein
MSAAEQIACSGVNTPVQAIRSDVHPAYGIPRLVRIVLILSFGHRQFPLLVFHVSLIAPQTVLLYSIQETQPPPKPARRKPPTMYGQFRINRHNNPVR